jgi:hypothetical protein
MCHHFKVAGESIVGFSVQLHLPQAALAFPACSFIAGVWSQRVKVSPVSSSISISSYDRIILNRDFTELQN